MTNEFIRLAIFIILSVGIITAWNYLKSDIQLPEKIETHVQTDTPSGMITTPMYKLYQLAQNKIKSHGFSIILITILLKLITLPLGLLSSKSNTRMQAFQKEMDLIKKENKFSKEQLAKTTMDLMKKHKVNPLTGILFMLLQAPLYFSFYSVLNNAPELAGQGFLGFIADLSLPDPLYMLPLLSAVLMTVHLLLTMKGKNKLIFLLPAVGFVFTMKLSSSVQIYILISTAVSIITHLMGTKPPLPVSRTRPV